MLTQPVRLLDHSHSRYPHMHTHAHIQKHAYMRTHTHNRAAYKDEHAQQQQRISCCCRSQLVKWLRNCTRCMQYAIVNMCSHGHLRLSHSLDYHMCRYTACEATMSVDDATSAWLYNVRCHTPCYPSSAVLLGTLAHSSSLPCSGSQKGKLLFRGILPIRQLHHVVVLRVKSLHFALGAHRLSSFAGPELNAIITCCRAPLTQEGLYEACRDAKACILRISSSSSALGHSTGCTFWASFWASRAGKPGSLPQSQRQTNPCAPTRTQAVWSDEFRLVHESSPQPPPQQRQRQLHHRHRGKPHKATLQRQLERHVLPQQPHLPQLLHQQPQTQTQSLRLQYQYLNSNLAFANGTPVVCWDCSTPVDYMCTRYFSHRH